MNTFRRFSRRAWLLHGYLLASMILWPVPTVRSYWTWNTATNAKVEIANPPLSESWWDDDGDDDGMTNAEEVAFGSNPFQKDSDYDGLTDTDERDITPAMLGGVITTDPWNWDSNGNGHSDHDEYWAWQSGLTLNVSYYGQTPPSPLPTDYYRDLDGDGTFNLWDYAPTDSSVSSPPADPGSGTGTPPDPSTTDSDGDTHYDSSDSHPSLNYLWEDWNWNGTNDSQEPPPPSDSDGDTHYDTSDSHPYNPSLWEDWNWNGTNDSQEIPPTYPPDPTSPPDPYYTNSDGDSAMDANDSDPTNPSLWEDWNRNGTNDSFEPPDADGDGVTDADEYTAGTNPYFHDSDGDGLSDSEEYTAQTNPLLVDTDADGLTDHEEIFIYQKNPLLSRSLPGQQQVDYYRVNLADTDLDGIPDLVEAWYGRDPATDADAASDLDVDGHSDLEAYLAGWAFTVSFSSYDQDRDGITDARESYWGFNPYDPDDATQDADHDGLLNIEEIRLGLDPLSATTHGTPDLEYANTTWSLGWKACLNPGSSATTLDDDTDGDGMPDHWEHRHRLDLRDARDAIRDPDKDTLSNLTEYRFLSHPRIPKSESNTHDRDRLYATSSPLNASTAGGLMNRYRAQITADLTSAPTLSRFFGLDVPTGSGMSPLAPTFYFKKREKDDKAWPTSWTPGDSATVVGEMKPPSTYYREPVVCTCTFIGLPNPLPEGVVSGCCRTGATCGPELYCGCGYDPGGETHSPGGYSGSLAKFRVKVQFSRSNSRAKRFQVKKNGTVCYSFSVLPDKTPPCNTDHEVEGTFGGGETGSQTFLVEEVPVDDDAPDSPPVTFSTYDSAGSRYRKVGLNGLPLPDQKPQGQDESGERDEETYVDAYTRQLSHSVTDIYAQDSSTLLPLSVRRDVTGETWNIRNGLRIGERNDLPFGPCWRSNICSYVRFEVNSDKPTCTATVVDEQGGTTRFLSAGPSFPWEHTTEEFSNAKTAASELTGWAMTGFTMTKKFGTTCHYQPVYPRNYLITGLLGFAIDHDRISGSNEMSHHLFARLSWVRDRYGNRLIYEYPDDDTLTPSKIYDPERPGRKITFENDILGRVVAACGPSGETVSYEYQGQNGGLSKVIRGSGNFRYSYQEFMERDENFYRWGGSENLYFHQNLGSITDELGRNFSLSYAVDHDVTYDTFSAGKVERRNQLGMPRRVVSIHSPAGWVSFTGSREIHAGWPDQGGWPSGGSASDLSSMIDAEDASTTVSGPAGTVAYGFYSPMIKMPNLQGLTMERIANPLSFNFGVFYTSMMIKKFPLTSANGPFSSTSAISETYSFDPNISGALTAAIDASGNTTSFAYDGTYDDPVSETRLLADGTKVEKKFTYDPLTRVMTSMTDPMGVRTQYTIDNSRNKTTSAGTLPVWGLKTAEKVFDASNNLLRETRFSYDHPVFAGMVTKQWDISPNAAVMPSSVTETLLAPASDSLGQNTGWWCEVTQRSGTATTSGQLALTMTSTTTVYDLSGRKRTVIDPLAHMTNFGYDSDGRLARVDSADGAFKSLEYDLHGNLTAEHQGKKVGSDDATLTSTFHEYDGLNRRTKTTIDLNGNGVPDPNYTTANSPPSYDGDLVTTTTYNVFNLPVDVLDARGTVTRHGYDGLGRLTSKAVGKLITNPNGNWLPKTFSGYTTSFFYDGLNKGGSLFDVSGFKPNRTIDPMGTQTTVLYDKLYRPVSSSTIFKTGWLKSAPTLTAANTAVSQANAALNAASHNLAVAINTRNTASAAQAAAARLTQTRQQVQALLDPLQDDLDEANDVLSAITDIESEQYGLQLAFVETLEGQVLDLEEVLETVIEAETNATLRDSLAADLLQKTAAVTAANAAIPALQTQLNVAQQSVAQAEAMLSQAQIAAAPGYDPNIYSTAVTLTEYDLNGKATKVTDPLGRVTLNEYDSLGNLIKVTEPDLTTDTSDNPTVRSYYTHHGKPWKVIDQMGNETTTRYDALGRPVEAKGPPLTVSSSSSLQVSAITTTEYDAAGNVIAVTDPLGRVVETVYDERNRPTHVYAPTMWDAVIGQFVRPYAVTTYDALGQPVSVTDHTGATTTSHYDRAGRKWKVEAPAVEGGIAFPPNTLVRPTTLTSFDPGGLPVTVTNPLGQTITNTYDIYGRLTSTLDAEGIVNTFAYDAAGNRTLVKDGLNQQTTFKYDGLNRLIEQTFANGDTWTHTYNAVQKESQLSPRGILTSYDYDARDRLLTVATSGTEGGIAFPPTSRSYTYDNAGKLKTVTESTVAAGVSTPNAALAVSYTYDAMGRVTAESSHGQVHEYEYDLVGNRVKATYSTGRVVETSYDGLNRPEAIVDGDRLTRYGYDKAGRAVILVAANGQTSQNSYDPLGRLIDRVLYKTPAMDWEQRLARFQWEHDLLGNVTQQEETWPEETTGAYELRRTTMGYDANNRLTSETISHPTDGTQSTTYTYDDANNRSTKTVTGGAEPGHWDYDYNTANQLTAWEHQDVPGGSVLRSASLTYDDAGNRIGQALTNNQVTHAALSSQGLQFAAKLPGAAGNNLRVRFQNGTSGQEQPTVTFSGQEAVVSLAMDPATKAESTSQGIRYLAAEGGTSGNTLRVKMEKAQVGQLLQASLQGDIVQVRLAMDEGEPDTLHDQGIVYTAKKVPGDSLYSHNYIRLTAEAGQDERVVLSGDTVEVHLKTTPGDAAMASCQDLEFHSTASGKDGNGFRLQLAPNEGGEPLELSSVSNRSIKVLLEQEGGTHAEASIPEITYKAAKVGQKGNQMYVWHTFAEEGAATSVSLGWQALIVLLAHDKGDRATATWAEAGLTFTAQEVGQGGNQISITVSNPGSTDQPFSVSVDGSAIQIVLGSPDPTNPNAVPTASDVMTAVQAAAAGMVQVTSSGSSAENLTPTTLSLSGGGDNRQITATSAEVIAALAANPEAAACFKALPGTSSSPLSIGSMLLTGGEDGEVLTTTAELATLLSSGPAATHLTVLGAGSTEKVIVADLVFGQGGTGFEVESTASSVIARLQALTGVMERISVSGSGTTPLDALPTTSLTGGKKREITSTASEVVAAINAVPSISARLTASLAAGGGANILTPHETTLSGGGSDVASATTAAQVATLLNGQPAIAAKMSVAATSAATIVQAAPAQSLTGGGISSASTSSTAYTWDAQDRLASVTLPDGSEHRYAYDYRTRRISTGVRTPSSANETRTSIVFSGGLSVAEWEQESGTGVAPVLSAPPTVEYTRGPDMGGGVGGLLYTSRSESASASVSSSRTLRYNLSNGRGDIVAQSDSYASLTWTASYEAYGKRTKETGENKDKQRGNSKDEDPTGLLNEGFRYRDIETGVWLSRDPAGFVDGPNVYAYVKQNPWTAWDPLGLKAEVQTEKRPDGGKHTTFKIRGRVEFDQKSNFTDNEKKRLVSYVKRGLEETFSGREKDHTWKVELEIEDSAKNAKEDDHVFYFDSQKEGAHGEMGGLRMEFNGKFIIDQMNTANSLKGSENSILFYNAAMRKFGHEMAHTLGLRHPFNSIKGSDNGTWHPVDNKKLYPEGGYWGAKGLASENPIPELGYDNVMRYPPCNGVLLESSQVRLIQHYYDKGLLNGNLKTNPLNLHDDGGIRTEPVGSWPGFFSRQSEGGPWK